MTTARSLSNSLALSICLATAVWAQDGPTERTFAFRGAELRSVLDSLLRWYAVPLVFLEADVAGKRISAECASCDIEEALSVVLSGHGLRASRVASQFVLRTENDDAASDNSTFAVLLLDSLTGEPITGASILLSLLPDSTPFRWGSTGASGFFSLRHLHSGSYALHVRRIGYHTWHDRVSIGTDDEVVRELRLSSRELIQPHVTVEGRRSAFSAADGISRGVFIRSAPSDHHQYYLEGARVYNPVHFGGLTSAFNADALADIQPVAGGVPPYYGGRIGGVMDVSLRTGSRETFGGSVEGGSLGSGMILEGPLFGSSSFVFSGRQVYPDVLSRFSFPHQQASDLHATELMLKLDHALSGRQKLSVTGFFAQDTYERSVAGEADLHLGNDLRWHNSAATVRWQGVLGPSLFFSASGALTDYGFSAGQRFRVGALPSDFFSSEAGIQDISLRAHAEYFYDRFHTMVAGVELVRHRLSGSIDAFSSQLITATLGGPSPWELSVYVQDQWRLAPAVLAEFGARATSFVATERASSSVDPRFSLMVLLDEDQRITGSVSAVTQYLHPYRHSGIFLYYPSIFFYPTDADVPPSTSLHGTVGYERAFMEDRYRIALESYFRVTRNLHEFASDTARPAVWDLSDLLIIGEGTSYGTGFTFEKRTGSLGGTVRYGLSWTMHRFDEVNGGKPFQPRFDRRHELFASVTYALSDSWSFGGLCLLSSNHLPLLESTVEGTHTRSNPVEITVGADAKYAEPFDLNGGRLPGFQRLELRTSHSFEMLGKTWEGTFRLLNGYGLIDPFRWRLTGNADPRLRWQISFEAPPLFPLYPSLSLRMKL